jgi:hypothetical protein
MNEPKDAKQKSWLRRQLAELRKLGGRLLPAVTATGVWIATAAVSQLAAGFAHSYGDPSVHNWTQGVDAWVHAGGAVAVGLGLMAAASVELLLRGGRTTKVHVVFAFATALPLAYFVLTTGVVLRGNALQDEAVNVSGLVLVVGICLRAIVEVVKALS